MPNKRNTTGLVFDRMDTIGDYLVVFDPHIPARHRRSLWEQVTKYQAEAQAYAEMAYLEYDAAEKLRLVRDARKYFRVFIRYWTKCCKTGEFRFGQANTLRNMRGKAERVAARLNSYLGIMSHFDTDEMRDKLLARLCGWEGILYRGEGDKKVAVSSACRRRDRLARQYRARCRSFNEFRRKVLAAVG